MHAWASSVLSTAGSSLLPGTLTMPLTAEFPGHLTSHCPSSLLSFNSLYVLSPFQHISIEIEKKDTVALEESQTKPETSAHSLPGFFAMILPFPTPFLGSLPVLNGCLQEECPERRTPTKFSLSCLFSNCI